MIYVALPILNESHNIPKLLECLRHQSTTDFTLVACVNQYESWWNNNEKVQQCIDNQLSIELLNKNQGFDIEVIDRSSVGNGWRDKKGGVGWARKTIMDYISVNAKPNDIIVSVDADTYYSHGYMESVHNIFSKNTSLVGLANPYFHNLNGDITDRLILRYEIYMRYYLLNMMRIVNPYAFTALGSAMAFPVWAYKKAGGLTPVASGEDFYFLQKLVKIGEISSWNTEIAYPSPRFSDRVLFGTGPALIKGNTGNWSSYPHYHYSSFDNICDTYKLFKKLYANNIATPMDEFLMEQTNNTELWNPIRKNYKDIDNFVRACSNKVDGLRILQYLRKQQENIKFDDEQILYNYILSFHNKSIDNELLSGIEHLDYNKSSINLLNKLRTFLFEEEMKMRKELA